MENDARVIGVRFTVHSAKVDELGEEFEALERVLPALERSDKPLFVYASDASTLKSIVSRVPPSVLLVFDHAGVPHSMLEKQGEDKALAAYCELLSALKRRGGRVLLRGPLYRASLAVAANSNDENDDEECSRVAQRFVRAAVDALGAEQLLLWGGSDAPNVALSDSASQRVARRGTLRFTDVHHIRSLWRASGVLSESEIKAATPIGELALERMLGGDTSSGEARRAHEVLRDARARHNAECATRTPLIHTPLPDWVFFVLLSFYMLDC